MSPKSESDRDAGPVREDGPDLDAGPDREDGAEGSRHPDRRDLLALAMIGAITPALGGFGAAQAGASDAALHEITERALDELILPGHRDFAARTATLAEVAQDCADREALVDAYEQAFDAWMEIAHFRFGPAESEGRALAIEFWPDPKGFVRRSLGALLEDQDPAVEDPAEFRKVSVAARGLTALDRLLFDEDAPDASQGYPCELVQAIATDLALTAAELLADWEEVHAPDMRAAGAGEGRIYLDVEEPPRALYTALITGAQMTEEARLGRPLGTYDRPRPTQAEAWRSGRPLRNVALSIEALSRLSEVFAPALAPDDAESLAAAWARALQVAERAPGPLVETVSDPARRIGVESAATALHTARERSEHLIAPALDLSPGFNALDGD